MSNMQYNYALVGVFLGWILSSITYLIKDSATRRRIIKKNIYKLEDIRINIKTHIISATESKIDHDDIKIYESIRRRSIIDRYQEDNLLIKHFENITSDIAEYYPQDSMDLDANLKFYFTYKRLKLEKVSHGDTALYMRMILPTERGYLISYLRLEKQLLKLCRRVSLRLYFKQKKRMNYPANSVWLQALYETGVIKWKISKLDYFLKKPIAKANSKKRLKDIISKVSNYFTLLQFRKHLSEQQVYTILKVIDLEKRLIKKSNQE